MNKHVLIVESVNDKYFLEAVIQHFNLQQIEIDRPICRIDEYDCLRGFNEQKLKHRFIELKDDIRKHGVEKVGIVVDADQARRSKRLGQVGNALTEVFETPMLTQSSTFVRDPELDVKFACFVMNVDGAGELETVLKAIKSEDSIFADCLEQWQNCLGEREKSIKPKDFDKFWIQIYHRFDCCTSKDQKQAGRKCDFEASMQKGIYNLDHPLLDDLKSFLKLFNS